MREGANRHVHDVRRFNVWKNQLKRLGVLTSQKDVDQPQPPASSPLICAQVIRSQPSWSGDGQAAICAARVMLTSGVTIEVPVGIAPEALGQLFGAALRFAPLSEGGVSR